MAVLNIKGAYVGEIRIQVNRLDRPEVMTQNGPSELYRCILEIDPDVVVEAVGGEIYHVQAESIYQPLIGEDGEDFKDRQWTTPEWLKALEAAGTGGVTKLRNKHGFQNP